MLRERSKRRLLLALLLSPLLAGCSSAPSERWTNFAYPKEHLTRIEESTDEHGLYLEYSGITREELYRQVETALIGAGYARVGEVFDGAVLGFAKGEDELAVKVDQVGEKLFLAVFDAQGIDPLLHGVVFGRYQVGETITGTEAAERLKKDLSD